jgi:hypothetical protein
LALDLKVKAIKQNKKIVLQLRLKVSIARKRHLIGINLVRGEISDCARCMTSHWKVILLHEIESNSNDIKIMSFDLND